MVPDAFWEAGNVIVAYKQLYGRVPQGDVVSDSGEAAWIHRGSHCAAGHLDKDAHRPDCWVTEENRRYKDDAILGYIVEDVDAAKAAMLCFQTKDGQSKCEMKSSFEKVKKDKKKTSYTYRC